jgi:triacylglycerol lipase
MKQIALFIFVIVCPSAFAQQGKSAAGTKYPIVFIHGLLGFSERLGFIASYWGEIPERLTEQGAKILFAKVSQTNSIAERGEQLYQQLLGWGYEKYNLIGHSLGGLDARFVMENHPELVASVTTISTPNKGTKIADYLAHGVRVNSYWIKSIVALGEILGHVIGSIAGEWHIQNVLGALYNLTTKDVLEFNQEFPVGIPGEDCGEGAAEHRGIKLFSWGSFGVALPSRFDLFSRLMTNTTKIFADDEKNDGLVAICSMKFGKWLGAIGGGHHLIPVGGIVSSITDEQRAWSSKMFLNHARRLKRNGL